MGLMPASDPEQIISFPANKAPGCATQSLVGGYLENTYPFAPNHWYYRKL